MLGIVVDDFLIVGLEEKEEDLVVHQKKEGLSKKIDIQGGFFNWSALKMTKSQTLRKF